MTLRDFADIAQVVSALGVVVSLFYLAAQIRQSAKVSRAEIRQQLAGQQIALLVATATDPTLRSAIANDRAGKPLSEDETRALTAYSGASLRLFESNHAQWELGVLSNDDWNALVRLYSRRLSSPVVQRVVTQSPDIWNPRFGRLLDELTEKTGAA